jgi:hypothetical protein
VHSQAAGIQRTYYRSKPSGTVLAKQDTWQRNYPIRDYRHVLFPGVTHWRDLRPMLIRDGQVWTLIPGSLDRGPTVMKYARQRNGITFLHRYPQRFLQCLLLELFYDTFKTTSIPVSRVEMYRMTGKFVEWSCCVHGAISASAWTEWGKTWNTSVRGDELLDEKLCRNDVDSKTIFANVPVHVSDGNLWHW